MASLWYESANDSMHQALVEWVFYGTGKKAVFDAYETLQGRQRAAWDQEVRRAFLAFHGAPEATMYRRLKTGDVPEDPRGTSVTTRDVRDEGAQAAVYSVRVEDVLAHHAQEDTPLSSKAFGHESEVILRLDSGARLLEVVSMRKQNPTMLHGSQAWKGDPRITARKGNVEYGPGLYLTTSYERAKKYGAVRQFNLADDLTFSDEVKIPLSEMVSFLREQSLRGRFPARKTTTIIERLRDYADRTGHRDLLADVLINNLVNDDLGHGAGGLALASFLVEHGVDASRNRTGGAAGESELWIILYDLRKIQENGPVSRSYETQKRFADLDGKKTLPLQGSGASAGRHENPLARLDPPIAEVRSGDLLTVYHATEKKGFADLSHGVDSQRKHGRIYGMDPHAGLFVATDKRVAQSFAQRHGAVILEMRVRAANLHGVYPNGNIWGAKEDRLWRDKYPRSFRPGLSESLSMPLVSDPQALHLGYIPPEDIVAVWLDGDRLHRRQALKRLGLPDYQADFVSPAAASLDALLAALERGDGTNREAALVGLGFQVRRARAQGGKEQLVSEFVAGHALGVPTGERYARIVVDELWKRF